MLHIKYHLSEEEYFNYNYYTAWAAPDRRQYRILYYTKVLLLYAAVAGLYIIANPDHQWKTDLMVFGAIALIYTILVPFLIRRSVRKRVKDILKRPENKHVLEECEVILMDTGIVDKDKASESKYQWEAIVKKAETPTGYYLYTNSYHAIVIPKRALAGPGEEKELERLMNTYLPLSSEFPSY